MSEAEIDNKVEKLLNDIEDDKDRIADLEDEDCVPCGVDPETGIYQHENSGCPKWPGNGECPYQNSDNLNDRHQRLCSLSLLTSCFHNPDLATDQQTFTGFLMEKSLKNNYR